MASIVNQIGMFFWNIFHRPQFTDVIDIILVAILIYQLIMLTRGTRASDVVKGFILLLVARFLSELLGLPAITWILKLIVSNGVLVMVILFQPELRHALEQLGRGAKFELPGSSKVDENTRIITEIVQCLTNLSRRRVGSSSSSTARLSAF